MEFKNGDIIELTHYAHRDTWVLVHKDFCENKADFSKKQSKNYLPFLMLSGLWNDGDKYTSKPYGKTNGQLTRGHFNSIKVIGHLSTITKEQLEKLK